MNRLLFFVFTILSFVEVASAVILVVPEERDWGEYDHVCLFKTIQKYSFLPNGLEPGVAKSYLSSNLTENEFVRKNIAERFPKKAFRIEDIPATLVDVATFHKDIFSFYQRKNTNLLSWEDTSTWNEKTKRSIYFKLSKLVLSAVDKEQSYEKALGTLFSEMEKVIQKKPSMMGIIEDFENGGLLREGLKREEQAIKENSFIWFRGTKGVAIKGSLTLDWPLQADKIDSFHTITQKECFENMRSFSFGCSLLAGSIDPNACAYNVISKYGYSGYSLQIRKEEVISGQPLWFIPETNPMLQVISRGEWFHPRSNGNIVDCHSCDFKYSPSLNYKKLALKMSELLRDHATLIMYKGEVATDASHQKEKKEFKEAHQKLHQFFEAEKE